MMSHRPERPQRKTTSNQSRIPTLDDVLGRRSVPTANTRASSSNKKIVSIPLVPHEVHKRRRLAEIIGTGGTTSVAINPLVATAAGSRLATSYITGYDREIRPRQYPRRRRRRRLLSDAVVGRNSTVSPPHQQSTREEQQQDLELPEQRQDQVVSLYQGFGTHYADVWVGSPPQRQTLIVDTGSATTAFACSGCSPSRCGRLTRYHTDPLFEERKSTSFQKITCSDCFLGTCTGQGTTTEECRFGVAYQEGSNWTAYEAIDQCYVGGLHTQRLLPSSTTTTSKTNATTTTNAATQQNNNEPGLLVADGVNPYRAAMDYTFDLRFGCQTQMTGPFRTQMADGIMGMDIGKPAIWNQMYLQGTIESRSFSLCFNRPIPGVTIRKSGTPAGAMTLGGTDPRLHHPHHAMVYSATNTDGAGFFSVQLHHVYLRSSRGGGSVIQATDDPTVRVLPLQIDPNLMNHGEIIIDSGTTDTYFVHHLSEPFHQAWLEMVGRPYTNDPIALTEEELNNLPTILLQFKGDTDSNADILAKASSENDPNKSQQIPLAQSLDPINPLDVLLAVPPSHYMEYQDAKGMYVPGIYFEEADGSVLGANVMMLHDIFFDVERYRIGWIESHCDYNQLASPYLPSPPVAMNNSRAESETIRLAGGAGRTKNGAAVPNNVKLRGRVDASGRLASNKVATVSDGFCSSVECRLFVILCIVTIWVWVATSTIKRRKLRAQRSGGLESLLVNNVTPSANGSTSNHQSTSSYHLDSMAQSDDEVSTTIPIRDPRSFQRRGVLRSRSHRPTSLSDTEDERPINAGSVRGRASTRRAVLRARSSQIVL